MASSSRREKSESLIRHLGLHPGFADGPVLPAIGLCAPRHLEVTERAGRELPHDRSEEGCPVGIRRRGQVLLQQIAGGGPSGPLLQAVRDDPDRDWQAVGVAHDAASAGSGRFGVRLTSSTSCSR